jgi:hypothetical protein
MGYLHQFECDIFIAFDSEGSRATKTSFERWTVDFRNRLEADLREQLHRDVRISLDGYDPRTDTLAVAAESALFVFISSAESCRPGSLCCRELAAFAAGAHPNEEVSRQQHLVVWRSDPTPNSLPRELAKCDQYRFDSLDEGQYESFLASIKSRLARSRDRIERTIFVAPVRPKFLHIAKQLCSDYDRWSWAVLRMPKGSAMPFEVECRRRLRWSGRSVHILDQQMDERDPGWMSSKEAICLRAARKRFGTGSDRIFQYSEGLLESEVLTQKFGEALDYSAAKHDLRLVLEELRSRHEREVSFEVEEERVASPESRAVESVEFSITSPPSVKADSSFIVHFWAHQTSQRNQVLERARQAAVGAEVQITSEGPEMLEVGARLQVSLRIDDLIVKNNTGSLLWNGEIASASFVIAVPRTVTPGLKIGTVKVSRQGVALSIRRVHFTVQVGPAATRAEQLPVQEVRYRKAFASYASEDRDRVAVGVQCLRKENRDLDVFMDVLKLRSGDDWAARLAEEIPRNDIFYLFWSRHAKNSRWVAREWRCALRAKGLDFIDPIALARPDRVPPPRELRKLHFGDPTVWLS